MAILKLKGEPEPIEISNQRAKEIQKDWLNNELPEIIEAGNITFSKRDLKAVLTDEQLYDNLKQKNENESYTLWLEEKREMQNMPAITSDLRFTITLRCLL